MVVEVLVTPASSEEIVSSGWNTWSIVPVTAKTVPTTGVVEVEAGQAEPDGRRGAGQPVRLVIAWPVRALRAATWTAGCA